jgi:signal transduction histidine kinase
VRIKKIYKRKNGDKILIKIHSLQLKIILPILFILIIVFFTSSILIIDREYNTAKNTLIDNSESYASLSVNDYIKVYNNYKIGFGFYYLRENIENIMKLNSEIIQIQILDVNGKILFDTVEIDEIEYNEQQNGVRYLEDDFLIERAGSSISSTVINESGNHIDIIQPYFDDWDRHDYSVRYFFSLSNLENKRGEMYQTLLLYAVIFIIISFLLIFILFNRFITVPIKNLMKSVRLMSKGNLGKLVKVNSKDELGELATAFNKLSIDLKKSQDSLKQYSMNLEKLVSKRTEELEDKTDYLEMINKDLEKTKKELDSLNKELEKRIRYRTKEVEQLLKQKDEFINQLSHDLKTPLTPLTILLPILEKQETNQKRKEILQVLIRNTNYMKNIAIKTLKLAKLNSSKTKFNLENIDLNKEIKRIIENKKSLFKSKKIKIKNNIVGKKFVIADKLRLEELITNIFENSFKYSNKNSEITIDAQEEKDYVKISIKDQGVGMTKNQIKHIFDEFYKVDSSRHDSDSSGLGLTICKRIVEKLNGKIWVESQGIGKGTSVFFTLPIYNKNKKIEKE